MCQDDAEGDGEMTYMNMKGKILDGDNVIAENVDVLIYGSPPLSKPTSWGGYCELPSDVTVRAGMVFRLILEDGRSGEIHVTGTRFGSGAIRLEFHGTRSLE